MVTLHIGVGNIVLSLRHAQSLKDKRRIVQSLIQKLRNEGFSVTESAYHDEIKRASIGYGWVGRGPTHVEEQLREVEKFLLGDFLVADHKREVFDFGSDSEIEIPELEPDY